jgi:hypothetical protein
MHVDVNDRQINKFSIKNSFFRLERRKSKIGLSFIQYQSRQNPYYMNTKTKTGREMIEKNTSHRDSITN